MIKLEISKSFIKNICDEINKKVFDINSKIDESTKKRYILLISKANYIAFNIK